MFGAHDLKCRNAKEVIIRMRTAFILEKSLFPSSDLRPLNILIKNDEQLKELLSTQALNWRIVDSCTFFKQAD